MQHKPINLDDLPRDMLNVIASKLDFASLLNLKSTSKFFSTNIHITPQTYQKTIKLLNLILRCLYASDEISNETTSRVSAGVSLFAKYIIKSIYFMDQAEIDKELILLQSEFRLLESNLPNNTGYIFSNSGKCYLLNEGSLSEKPTEYSLTDEEIKAIQTVTDNTNKQVDLALLTRSQASEITKIIKAAYNEDISLLPSQKEMANNIKKLVTLCAATYISAMLTEDDAYGLKNNSNPGKLWYPYTSWKNEKAGFFKLNKEFKNNLFIEFLTDRLIQEKLPFSTDVITPNLIGNYFKPQKALPLFQQLLGFYNIISIDKHLNRDKPMNMTI